MGKLDGKVVIVTGASRGIGKAIAQLFAREGAKVACAARTLNEGDSVLDGSLNDTVSEIKKLGGTAVAIPTNVAEESDCIDLVETTRQAFGPINVLVNVARYYIPSILIKDLQLKLWALSFAVNVQAPFILSREVLPDMIRVRGGAIVSISSGGARGPGRGPYKTSGEVKLMQGTTKDIMDNFTGGSAEEEYIIRQDGLGSTTYGATKAALERFTQGLAEEVYNYGIIVAAVSPSQGVLGPMGVYYAKHNLDSIPASVTSKSRGEPPEMMAKAALLLATEPFNKVTGRVTYSQAILKEFGWIVDGRGTGIDAPGSGYSQQ
jgi:citronellol/citronellal dehydrogenase